jgi:hypothetical protein
MDFIQNVAAESADAGQNSSKGRWMAGQAVRSNRAEA